MLLGALHTGLALAVLLLPWCDGIGAGKNPPRRSRKDKEEERHNRLAVQPHFIEVETTEKIAPTLPSRPCPFPSLPY